VTNTWPENNFSDPFRDFFFKKVTSDFSDISKEPYARLWPKLVLQSLSNYCRTVYSLPLPPDSRLGTQHFWTGNAKVLQANAKFLVGAQNICERKKQLFLSYILFFFFPPLCPLRGFDVKKCLVPLKGLETHTFPCGRYLSHRLLCIYSFSESHACTLEKYVQFRKP